MDSYIFGAEAAEEKFKEVIKSYEAIKQERKNSI
jgi:DnaJ-class molecular chaperone